VIRHFLNPPNWFTSASIFCSTYALALIIGEGAAGLDEKTLVKACVLVIFGGVFDLLDGRVARMTNRFTEFGMQLDSIADIISFGVAPAMLAWAWRLHEWGSLGAIVTFWYVLAAAFRLARFNVNSVHRAWPLEGHSQGLTTTMGGGALVTLVWVSNGYLHEYVQVSTGLVAVAVIVLGFLMVSSVPFRNFKDIRRNRFASVSLAVALALSLAGAVVLDPSMLFGVGAFLYVTWGLVDGLAVAVHHRRLGRTLDPDEEVGLAEFVESALAQYDDEDEREEFTEEHVKLRR